MAEIEWTPEQRAAIASNMRKVAEALNIASAQMRKSAEAAGPRMREALEAMSRSSRRAVIRNDESGPSPG